MRVCNCEHIVHEEPEKNKVHADYVQNISDDAEPIRSRYIGEVCQACASSCVKEYVTKSYLNKAMAIGLAKQINNYSAGEEYGNARAIQVMSGDYQVIFRNDALGDVAEDETTWWLITSGDEYGDECVVLQPAWVHIYDTDAVENFDLIDLLTRTQVEHMTGSLAVEVGAALYSRIHSFAYVSGLKKVADWKDYLGPDLDPLEFQ